MRTAPAPATAEAVCLCLDPVLTTHGFQAGQPGIEAERVGVIYCAAQHDFRARFPALAPSTDDDDGHACTDLTVSVVLGPTPRLSEVNLDGVGIDELLHDARRQDLLPRAALLLDSPLEAALEQLAALLTAILEGASATTDPASEATGP